MADVGIVIIIVTIYDREKEFIRLVWWQLEEIKWWLYGQLKER